MRTKSLVFKVKFKILLRKFYFDKEFKVNKEIDR